MQRFFCVFSFISPQRWVHCRLANVKFFIYLFLVERVHIVRGRTRDRLKDRLYLINLAALSPYCAFGVLACFLRVDTFGEDGRCLIGVQRQMAILMIIYDLLINVLSSAYRANHSYILPSYFFYPSLVCIPFETPTPVSRESLNELLVVNPITSLT